MVFSLTNTNKRFFFPSFLEKYDHPQHPAFELKLIDWLIAVTIKLIDWLIAIWPNSRTHKKCFQPFFQKFRRKAKRRPFGGMFQSLKSYRFAYISVTCMNVIYDFVVVLVPFTSCWSSPKCQDHFDILTCCLLQQSWNGQEMAMNLCDNLLSPKSTITINVGMWADCEAPPLVWNEPSREQKAIAR